MPSTAKLYPRPRQPGHRFLPGDFLPALAIAFLVAATPAAAVPNAPSSSASTDQAGTPTPAATPDPPGATPAAAVSGRIEVVDRPSLTVAPLAVVAETLRREPGGTAVVDAEDVRAGRASTLADVLGGVPGVIAQPRFGAEEARLSIRGSGLQRTFHGRGLQLLQDGVPLNLADGSFDFQAVEPLAMRYATVLRGANAFDRGATTLGGAIDFVSPTGHDAAPRIRLEGGSFAYLRGEAALAARGERLDGFLSLSHFGQDGFRDHADQSTQRLFGNLGWRHHESAESRVYLTAVRTDSELPGSLTRAQLFADPTRAAAGNLALDQKRDFDLLRLSGRSVLAAGGGTLEGGAFVSYKHLDHPIFQVIDQLSHDLGANLRFTRLLGEGNGAHQLTAGIGGAYGELADERFLNLAGRRGARTALGDTTSSNLTVFVEDRLRLGEQVTLVAGLAGSRAERTFDDRFLANGDQSDDRSFSALLPRLGIVFQAASGWSLFGNVARSFEPPTFGELSNLGGSGLAPVDDQTATSLELGTRGQLGPVAVDLVVYQARIDGELLALADEVGNPLGTVNADRTTHSGVELGLASRQRLGQLTLGWRVAYTLGRFRFDDDPVYGDNELAGLPEHLLRASAELAFGDGWFVGPVVTWSPEDSWVDHANTLDAPDYTVWDLRAGYRGDAAWQAFVEGRNLTDRTYAATTGVVADARGRDSAQFLPGDGRAVYAGVEWRWGGR